MPTFKLDGKELPFTPGQTIITAAWKQGIEIPHYCWHPGLSVAANCRMCLVEIMPPPNQRAVMLDVLEWDAEAKDYKPQRKPKLQPACQIAITEGMDVRSDTSEHVKQARKDVQEFLLLQHPVDCPICDQAGECKLQDYWLEHGQYSKRMRDEPVHKPKGVSFGDTIVYDAERCVVCTRCVRFMAEVAKDPVLDQRERGNVKEIIVSPGRKLEGNYTFMTEHVCPVGALTTKDFRFKARVWFLRGSKSVCQGCATGCNAWLDFDPRYNKVERYRPRENEAVNKFWMCDHGMMSYTSAHEGRLVDARVSGKAASNAKALDKVKKAFEGVPHTSIAIVHSAQASLEDNWALAELGKLFGAESAFVAAAPPGDRDDILIHVDKNSNAAGVKLVAPNAKSWTDFLAAVEAGSVRHVIALGASVGDVGEKLGKLEALVVIATHESPFASAATVVLPATSWAEQSATYVNAKGIKQISEKAIEPQGASKQALLHLADIAKALGHEATWSKLKDVRQQARRRNLERTRRAPHDGDAGGLIMSGTQLVWALIKILVMIGFVVNMAAVLTWLDRRQGAMMQDRVGPNRALIKIFGREIRLAGLLHVGADGLKFFTKEFFQPPRADKVLFSLAPILSMMPVMALVAVIPFGDTLCLREVMRTASDGGWVWPVVPRFGLCGAQASSVDMMVSPLNVGILYVFALAGQGIVGAAIAGWSSDNKYSLMGALRAAARWSRTKSRWASRSSAR